MQKKIYLLSGEVSGDTHGAELINALREQQPQLGFFGYGGPEMRSASHNSTQDWVEDAAVMGIWEVLKRYPWFKKQFKTILADILTTKPDALILIDYPGFNLRIAKAVHEALPSTKIIYYISPQVWAWNKGRIPKMATYLDKMLCIFPFEKSLFESSGLPTEFVGHPIVDELEAKKIDTTRDPNLIGLFPGSREREIARLFPVMLEAVRRMHNENPDWKYASPAASPKLADQMRELLKKSKLPDNVVTITQGGSHKLMQEANCGVIASGTATLEAAWLGMPYCLIYRIAWPTYFIGKMLVKIDYIGLVNILAGKKVVEEFVQGDADPLHIQQSLEKFMADPKLAAELKAELAETAAKLGEPGCHHRAATAILETI